MAKRGNHQGFVNARVNANVEARSIIADALDLHMEMWMQDDPYYHPLPSDCVNAEGLCCPCCGGCFCTPTQKFAAVFMAKQGKLLRVQGWRAA